MGIEFITTAEWFDYPVAEELTIFDCKVIVDERVPKGRVLFVEQEII